MRKLFICFLIIVYIVSFQQYQEKALGAVLISGLKWEQNSPLVFNDTGHAHVYKDKIYFVGQYYVQEYDPKRGNWTMIAENGLGYRSFRGDSALIEDKIYIIHGWTDEKTKVYDIENNSISTFTYPPFKRIDVAVAKVNSILYVSGGWLDGDPTSLTKVEAFDPNNNTWWTVSPMNTGRKQHEMVGIGDYLYVIGGHTGFGFTNRTTSVEKYDPLTDEWEYIEDVQYEYEQCGSAVIENDSFILSNVTHTSIYEISTNTWNNWESFLYEDITPIDPDYEANFFANSIVCLDRTIFSIGLRDAPGTYYDYVWTLDLAEHDGQITKGNGVIFLLFSFIFIAVSTKKGRKKYNRR